MDRLFDGLAQGVRIVVGGDERPERQVSADDDLLDVQHLGELWHDRQRTASNASEQRTLAQLNHPAIAQLHDADTLVDGTPWFVMEYVEGVPLTAYCRSRNTSIQGRLRLLRAVQGIDLVEIEQAQECCGFGGTFAVKNADTSMAMLSDKLRRILDTRAEVCTAADSSCLMHIGGGLQRSKAGVRVMHLAEILASEDG